MRYNNREIISMTASLVFTFPIRLISSILIIVRLIESLDHVKISFFELFSPKIQTNFRYLMIDRQFRYENSQDFALKIAIFDEKL